MSTINKVILIGNAGGDPEVNYLESNGVCVANISIATTETWKNKDGEKQSKTEWHRVVFFRKLAEIVEKYVQKGHKIYVEGKLQTRKWDDKDGNKHYTTEVVADRMVMLTSQGGGNTIAEQQAEAYMGERATRDLTLDEAEAITKDIKNRKAPGDTGDLDPGDGNDDLPF